MSPPIVEWSWAMIFVAFAVFFVLLFIPAPYGKHDNPGKRLVSINPRLCWFLFESPNLLWVIKAITTRNPDDALLQTPNLILLGCFTFHYINRAVVYPLRMRGGQPWSLLPFASAVLFTSINGFMQTHALQSIQYPDSYTLHPRFCIGMALFAIGWCINAHSDSILRSLRTSAPTGPRYQIPRGGLFDWVSGANFLGEMVEWGGYALAARSMESTAFFIFTIAALLPRALHHHQWYLNTFEDYPKSRTAVIPFLL